jgi:hypothetical protein
LRVAERAEDAAIVHGQPEQPNYRGRDTGTSAVSGMVSEFNRFCNLKFCTGRKVNRRYRSELAAFLFAKE